ncbi:MAG: hypothetical protein GF398_09540 [Chitinivibrionales bacterium]|nr:hypothetical protein [Chitinivibrionales bacterium]
MVERIEINLLPAEYRVHKKGVTLQREIIWPAFGVLVIFAILAFVTFSLDSEVSLTENKIAEAEQAITKNKHIEKEIEQLQKQQTNIREKIRALQRISVNKEKWIRLFEVMCGKMPKYSWLTSVSERGASNPPILQMQGMSLLFSDVGVYMANLAESEYIKDVDLSKIENSNNEDSEYSFSITARLDPDAGIQKH